MGRSNAGRPTNTGSQLAVTNCGCDLNYKPLGCEQSWTECTILRNRSVQAIQDNIDYWCQTMTKRAHEFLHGVGLDLSIRDLLDYWLHPRSIRGTFDVEEGKCIIWRTCIFARESSTWPRDSLSMGHFYNTIL